MDEKCVKSDTPKECNDVDILELLDICRITCGRFGAIWPQPTGEANLR